MDAPVVTGVPIEATAQKVPANKSKLFTFGYLTRPSLTVLHHRTKLIYPIRYNITKN